MQTIISVDKVSLNIPIEFIFWGFVIAYVIHILEESTLAEIFVDKVKRNFWPDYSWKHFFGFNTILLLLNIIAVVLFDAFRGAWVILPLSLSVERTLNGIWHLGETIVTKKYSSGLLASVITWILMYFIIRYSILTGQLSINYVIISFVIGFLITVLMFSSLISFRRKYMK